MKHVEKFRKDCPKTEDSFRKPASSERKLYEKKTARKPQAEIIVDRMEKPEKVKIQDPNISRTVVSNCISDQWFHEKLRGVRVIVVSN